MKYCTYCGSPHEEGVAFCPGCGAKIENNDIPFTSEANFDGSGEAYTSVKDQSGSRLVATLSFLLPFIGFILWLVYRENRPGRATSAIKGIYAHLTFFYVPIVGFVLFFVWKNEKPDFAKIGLVASILSVVGIVLFFVLYIVVVVVALLIGFGVSPYVEYSLLPAISTLSRFL